METTKVAKGCSIDSFILSAMVPENDDVMLPLLSEESEKAYIVEMIKIACVVTGF